MYTENREQVLPKIIEKECEQQYHEYATSSFVNKLYDGSVKNLVTSLIFNQSQRANCYGRG